MTISVTWVDAALTAIRNLGAPASPAAERARIGPPMVARSLAILHTTVFDAWAVYDAVAIGTRLRTIRQPGATDPVKTRAISQAAYRVLVDQFPTEVAVFDAAMGALGFPTTDVTRDAVLPEGVGNLAADAVLAHFHDDGANQLGNLTSSGDIYADYTGYAPVNPPILVTAASSPSDMPHPDR